MNRIALVAIVLAVTLLGAVTSAIAQSALYTTVNVQSGKPVRLGAYSALKEDCTPGPLPEVMVKQTPKQGVFLVKQGKANTGPGGKCPAGREAPVQVAYYQSRIGYVGPDSVSYEVKTGTEVRSYSITLSVTADAPSRKRRDGLEL